MSSQLKLRDIGACVEVYHDMGVGEPWSLWCGELDRTLRCVWARRQIIHLAREMTDHSLVAIRRHFTSHRTCHSTIHDGERMSREREQTDTKYAEELEAIRAMLRQLCETPRVWDDSPRTRAEAARMERAR